MGKIVFMFPGQGAQYVGMGKDFYDSFACSKEIFDKANEVLDIDVKKLCFEENEDGQIVISGESKAVAEAGEALKEAGAKRVLPLKVSGPFHSPMLKPAGEKLLDVLADVEVDDPTVPYVSNTTAEFITSKDEVKELLGRQVYSSVCWEQSIEKMIADGADTFVEIGPGRTLCGFMRKIDRNVKAINIAKVEDLEKLKEIM